MSEDLDWLVADPGRQRIQVDGWGGEKSPWDLLAPGHA